MYRMLARMYNMRRGYGYLWKVFFCDRNEVCGPRTFDKKEEM